MLFIAKKRTLLVTSLLGTVLFAFAWVSPSAIYSSYYGKSLGEWGHLSDIKAYLPLKHLQKQMKKE